MPETATTTTGVPPPPLFRRKPRSRVRQLGLAVLGFGWFAVADALAGRAARGLTNRFNAEMERPLLTALFLVFLLTVGYAAFAALTGEAFGLRRAAGLPRRKTSAREWGLGAATGWGLAVFVVLPMAFGRSFHVRLWTDERAWALAGLNGVTLLVASLGLEMGLRGYGFRRLIAAIGAGWATASMAAALGIWQWFAADGTSVGVFVAMLFTVILSLAWLRTHGLWLGWGLRAAWSVGVGVLFGLPLRGDGSFASVVQTRAIGPAWLTGEGFGPEAAALAVLALMVAIAVLVRMTDDYAWEYTRPEIVAAGYPVEPAPPAAHAEMEREVEARPAALVQILPATPGSRSIDGQLR